MKKLRNKSVQQLYEAIVDNAKAQRGGITLPRELLHELYERGDAAEEYVIKMMALGRPWYTNAAGWLAQRIERVQPRLLRILGDKGAPAEFRAGAAHALGQAKVAAAVPVLQEIVRDRAMMGSEFDFGRLLFYSVRALGSIGSGARQALVELIALFDDPLTKDWDLQHCPFGNVIFRPDILESLVNIDRGNAEVIQRIHRSFYDDDGELFSVAPGLLVRSGASRAGVRTYLMEALSEQFYTPERDAQIRKVLFEEGPARECFRSAVVNALERLGREESGTAQS